MTHFGKKVVRAHFLHGQETADRLNATSKIPWQRTPWWLFWKKPWRRKGWVPDAYSGAHFLGWQYCDHSDFLFM